MQRLAVHELRAYRERISVDTQLADMAALSRWTAEIRFSAIQAPMALITGEQDILLENHRRMHRVAPHASMIILPKVGHLMLLEDPTAITKAIANWIASFPPA